MTVIPLFVALLAVLLSAPAKAGEPPQEAGWQQHVMPALDGINVLAMASNHERSTIALLDGGSSTENTDERKLTLVAFDPAGKQTRSIDLDSPMREAAPFYLALRAGLAIDGNDIAYVAVAGRDNVVVLARVDLRGVGAPLIKVIKVGGSYGGVSTLRYTRQGRLMLAGKLDRHGYVAAVSPQGNLDWIKSYDKVATVFDLVERDRDFVLTGCTPGSMVCEDIWLARVDDAGDVLESQLRQGPARYAYLAEDGRQLALSFERLGPDLESGTALVEVFPGRTSLQESTSHILYKGRLAAPFSLSGGFGGFTAAGVAERGELLIFEVDASGRLAMLFKGRTEAPYYVNFNSVDVVRGGDVNYIGAKRTHVEGRRIESRLVFARIPAR